MCSLRERGRNSRKGDRDEDSERIGRWSISKHDFEDRDLGHDCWKSYKVRILSELPEMLHCVSVDWKWYFSMFALFHPMPH
jgi:hypothetical protein